MNFHEDVSSKLAFRLPPLIICGFITSFHYLRDAAKLDASSCQCPDYSSPGLATNLRLLSPTARANEGVVVLMIVTGCWGNIVGVQMHELNIFW